VKFWIALFLVAVFSNLPATPARAVDLPAGMVLVPAGEFIMGTNEVQEGGHTPGDSTPQHTRTLPAFYIDRTEVTNAQYKAYCDATGYPPPAHWHNGAYRPEQAQHPVTHVNWYEAQAYARWVGKRLPTEAEWEKAARGTDGRRYPWGDTWDIARVASNREGPGPVGSKPEGASPYGALDMASNVFEWTADWYDAYPGSNLKIRGYGQIYRVIRGGGFDAHDRDAATVHRAVLPPQVRSEWAGFRCARDAENSTTPSASPNTPVAQ
jgi:formylglycine-generating enzyme required for sulfatase activity